MTSGTTQPARVPAGMAALEEKLSAASAEADRLRESQTEAPTQADLAELGAQARVVDLFLQDVGEAMRQVFVAGLSFPAPELPEALSQLADRARAHRLATAVGLLSRLRLWVSSILAEPDLEARHHYARGAWDEAQRLVTWARLFKAEHDLLTVQSRLAAEASGAPQKRADEFKTRSLTAFPVGIDLAGSGKLMVFCLDTETRQPVVLADHLAELDAENPFARRAISRLFQDSIDLGQLLRSAVRLDDHPVTEKGGALLFRPAFRAIPKILPVSDTFKAPEPAPLPSGTIVPPGVYRLDARVKRRGGRAVLERGGDEASVEMTPALRFNLSKLLLRERSLDEQLALVVRHHDDRLSVLSATTDHDGRVFVGHDPALFLVAREVLQTQADKARNPGEGPALLFLRAATYVLGGAKPEALEALKAQIGDANAHGLDDTYRLALAGALLGRRLDPAWVKPLVEATMHLMVTEASSIDLTKLALVLGRKASEVSTGDLHRVDGGSAYRAIWLAMEAELVEQVRPLLAALLSTRYAGELKSPSVGDICARALLLALLSGDEVAGTAAAGDADEADEPDEADEEEGDEGDEAGGREGEGWKQANEFLEAHLATLLPERPNTKTPPMPDGIELLQIGDTRAFLRGEPRLGQTLASLHVPREKLRQACVDGLLDWLVEPREAPSHEALLGAADGLLVMVAAGAASFVVG